MICVLPLGVDDIVVITREEKSDNDFDLEFRDSHAGTRVTALDTLLHNREGSVRKPKKIK